MRNTASISRSRIGALFLPVESCLPATPDNSYCALCSF